MPKRLIRMLETFTSDELERGEVELAEVEPAPEPPEEEQAEPWNSDKPSFRDRLMAYRRHVLEHGEGPERRG